MASDAPDGSSSLRDLEKEITCSICREHYTEPKKLSCGHYFCKQCILKLALKDGADKPFQCPECSEQVSLSGGGVDQLEDAQEITEPYKLKFCEDERAGILEKAICCVCTLGNKVVSFCKKCSDAVCDACVRAHRRMKAFASHQLVTLQDLKGEELEKLLTKKSIIQACPSHSNPQIAFCFDCSQLCCHDCIVESHRAHKFVFNRAASSRDRQKLLNELGRLDMVEKFVSEVQGNPELVGAQEDLWEDIQESFGKLHGILESRKNELLQEADRRVRERKDKVAAQQLKLCKACRDIRHLIWEAEECMNEGTDEEVMGAYVDLLKRIEASVEEYSKPEWALELPEEDELALEMSCAEPLQRLCNDEINLVHLQIEPSKCEVRFDDERPSRVNWTSTVQLHVHLSNGRAARSTCKIDSKVTCLSDNSNVDCQVEKAGTGIYHIKFTPTENKNHQLAVQVNDKDVTDNPFFFFVYVATVPEDQEEPEEEQPLPMVTSFEYTEEIMGDDEPWVWEDHGLELLFQDEVPAEAPVKKVEVSATTAGDFQLPENTELASVAFLVQCPFDLQNKVQMRIPHFASEVSSDDYELSFVTSKSVSPPFIFELVEGGDFNSNPEKGELKVNSFSMYAVVFVYKHGLKDFPDFLRNSYLVSLHRSSQFKYFPPNRYVWDVYFSVVKNVTTFQNLLREFARKESLNECTQSVMKFKKTDELKIVPPTLPDDVKGWSVSGEVTILREDIDGYTGGDPPHGSFQLKLVLDSNATHFNLIFDIDGVRHKRQDLRVELARPTTAGGGTGAGFDGPIPGCLLDLLCEEIHIKKYRRAVGKITVHQRIFLENDLDDKCLSKVAEKLADWKNKPYLIKVDHGEKESIEEKHRGNYVQERVHALNLWRKRSPMTTFNRLLAICIVGEWVDGTNVIIDILNTYEQSPASLQPIHPTQERNSFTKIAVGLVIGVAVIGALTVGTLFAVRKFRNSSTSSSSSI